MVLIFARRSSLIFFLLCVLCGVAIVGAQLWDDSPIESVPTGFISSDCQLPCWAGVQIGQTTIDDTLDALTQNLSQARISNSAGGVIVATILDESRSRMIANASIRFNVERVASEIYVTYEQIPFDYLLSRVGVPDCVAILEVGKTSLLHWVQNGITMRTIYTGDLRALVRQPSYVSELQINTIPYCDQADTIAWQGWMSDTAYAEQQGQ